MLLIKNGLVINPANDFEKKTDILIDNGKVISIADNLEATPDTEVIDATGMVVAPGLVDVHVHFRDPGFTYKEDIETGAKASLRGGFTSVVMMANTKPCIDNADTLSYVLEKGKETGLHVYACATVTKGMQGKELTDMDKLLEIGAVGFTDDGVPIMDEAVLQEALIKAAKLNVPVSLHEENPKFISNNGVNKGIASEHFGIGGSPRDAEISMIERDLKLALETKASMDIQHISTKEGVELVRQARNQSDCDNIHAEATPHHFTLTEEAAVKYGTFAKMNPPLRTEEDRLAIIEGLKDGTIDMIATDHAPHSNEEKARKITEAPSGIIGLETSLSLGITELVKKGHLTMKELLACMTYNPARVYHLENAGQISEGAVADLVIFNPDEEWIPKEYASKSENTPFTGWKLYGTVHYTITDGKIQFQR